MTIGYETREQFDEALDKLKAKTGADTVMPGVDQIARVIQQHDQPDDPFDELDEEGRESHRKVARAILALIRAARVKELVSG